MCGICGYVGQPPEGQWGQTYQLVTALLVEAEIRGRDATGFVAVTEPSKDPGLQGLVIDKRPIRSSLFVKVNNQWRSLARHRCTTVLGHARLATNGTAKDNINNHPHCGRDGLYIIHNGVIHNADQLASNQHLELRSECDSEIILRIMERHAHPSDGLWSCLRQVEGSMAVAVYDSRHDQTWLARNNGSPLWLARFKNDRRWFFASTPNILLNAFKSVLGQASIHRLEMLFPLAENTVQTLMSDGTFMAS